MEDMINQALSLGLEHLCFTEHEDIAYPDVDGTGVNCFRVDVSAYREHLLTMREKYNDRIQIYFGAELGLQHEIPEAVNAFPKRADFDFIIGSTHIVNGIDPYYPPYFEGRDEADAYMEYFLCTLQNVKAFRDFDVLGHLDYIVRYGPTKDKHYTYGRYQEVLDEIIKTIVEKGIGLEINTGGYQRKGLRELHPSKAILTRYHELGGEIVTIGSDAHKLRDMGAAFHVAADLLEACGYRHYTIFKQRKPIFLPLH
jgi:histidinol-phosphatase (PHP family)